MNFLGRARLAVQAFRAAKSVSWEKVWLRAMESQLLGNQVTAPYKQHWGVYIAVKTIQTNFSRVPYTLWNGETQVEDHEALALLAKPNQVMSGDEIWDATASYLNLKGEVFWVLDKSIGMAAGVQVSRPAQIFVPNPDKFKPAINANNELIGWTYQNQMPIALEDIIHFKLFNPYNEIRGLSPFEVVRMQVETDYQAIKYNRSFFANDATPGSLIIDKNDSVSKSEWEALKVQWESRHVGAGNKHKIGLLSGDLDFKRMGLTHEEIGWIEQRKMTLDEVLGVWGVPRGIALQMDLKYASALAMRKQFWIDTMLPQLKLVQNKLQVDYVDKFAPGLKGEFDTDQIEELRDDLQKKSEVADRFWRMGVPFDQLNQRLDLGFEAFVGSDIGWLPMSQVPATFAVEPEPSNNDGKTITVDVKQIEDKALERAARLFKRRQKPLERVMRTNLKKFFAQQRERVMRAFNAKTVDAEIAEMIAVIELAWEKEDELLLAVTMPAFEQAVEQGGRHAHSLLGSGISFDLQSPLAVVQIGVHGNKIVGINTTTWRALRSEIRTGFTAGEPLTLVANRIRSVYDFALSRASTIARTETANSMNQTAFNVYGEEGAKGKRWATAVDEKVRDTHYEAEAEGVIPMSKTFSANGLLHPGDPNGEAGEVINCRCTIIPEVGD